MPQLNFTGDEVNAILERAVNLKKSTSMVSGFNTREPETLPIIELSKNGTNVRSFDRDSVHSEREDGTWYDGTSANQQELRIMPQTGQTIEVWTGNEWRTIEAQTITLPSVSGMHYIWLDENGIIQADITSPDGIFTQYAIVAIVYGDVDDQEAVVFSGEAHTSLLPSATHETLHWGLHTRYRSGFDISGMTLGGITHGTISAGIASDEELPVKSVDEALAHHLYKLNGTWKIVPPSNEVGYLIAGVGQFNPDTSYVNYQNANQEPRSGQNEIREIPGANDIVLIYFIGTSDGGYINKKIIGQEVYTHIGDAIKEAEFALQRLNQTVLPSPENWLNYISAANKAGELQAFADGSTYLDYRNSGVRL